MPQTFFIIPTAVGEAKLANAQALGQPIKFTHISVGDGNGALPTPDRNRTTLVNERRRAPINTLAPDAANPSQYIAEQVIPEDVGGWWIRELGLHDETGALCFYGNCAETYKPQLAEGSGRTQVVRMVILVSAGASVELKVDPSIVLATRGYVDTQIAAELDRRDEKQSVLVATVAPLVALSGLQAVDGINLTAGARVLVKDQAAGKDNGVYLAAAGNWTRTTDADSGVDMTPGMLVPVEQGTVNGDSVWQLTTDGAIIIGATPLAFKRVGDGYFAPLASPDFTGIPKVDTAPLGTATRQAASTAFVAAAIAALVNASPAQLDTLNELAAALGNDANFAATMTNALALKAPLASPALTGTPTAPTQAQFDASTKLVTAAFLKRFGVQFASVQPFTGALIGSVAHVGGMVYGYSNSLNSYSLPDSVADGIPVGATIRILNAGSQALTVVPKAADKVQSFAGGPATTSISLQVGSYADFTLVSSGVGAVWLASGTATLDGNGGSPFAALKSTSGYFKLPSGIIVQWMDTGAFNATAGNVATFYLPIAYPNAQVFALPASFNTTGATVVFNLYNYSNSWVQLNPNASANIRAVILSIGY